MVPCSFAKDFDVADPPAAAGFDVIQFNGLSDLRVLSQHPIMYAGVPWAIQTKDEMPIFIRFQERTVFTLSTQQIAKRYAKVIPRIALEHEHLFHATIAITLIHDRALANITKPSQVESYHLGQSAALFNRRLSGAISVNDCDAIWATAAFLCTTACFAVNTTNPEEAFPLKTVPSTDLEWLRMQAGLKVVWNAVDPYKTNNQLWRTDLHKTEDNCVFPLVPPSGIFGLSEDIVELCELTSESNNTNNPYHTAVWHLSWMLKLECDPSNILKFMVFAGGMSSAFKALLKQRDPRALLLLGLWYSKLVLSAWWMATRAAVESEAICRYLHRFHPDEHRILRLLEPVCQTHSVANRYHLQQFV